MAIPNVTSLDDTDIIRLYRDVINARLGKGGYELREILGSDLVNSLRQNTGGITSTSATSLTLSASGSGGIFVFTSGSAITLNVPEGLDTGFSCVLVQLGAGQITPTALGSVTINNRSSYTKTAGQYAPMSLLAVAADTFILFGDGA